MNESAIQVDAAMGGTYDVIVDIIRACGAEDSSGLRRCIAEKLTKDPLIGAAPELKMACINALGAYEALKDEGLDKLLPGYDNCLADLKAAIAKASR